MLDHGVEIAHRDGRGDRRDRAPDRELAPTVIEAAMVRREQAQGVPRSIGQQPLVQRHDHVVGVLEPARSAGVQLDQATGRPTRQITCEHGAHEGVQLEPAAGTPPGDEQAVGFSGVEQLAGVGPVGQRAGEARVHPWHDGGRREHVDHLRRLVRQHLVQHVVLHELVVRCPRPRGDRLGALGTRGQCGQLQAGGPAIGALDGRLDALRRQARGQSRHQLDRLVRREPQLGQPDLADLTARPHPVDRELRLPP